MVKLSLLCMLVIAMMLLLSSCGMTISTGKQKIANAGNTVNGILNDIAAGGTKSEISQHAPYGIGVGVNPGRVVWAHDPASVNWDGEGYWWELKHFNETAIQAMVEKSIVSLAGKEDIEAAWNTLFTAHNASHGTQGGYRPGQKIAIKVNLNGTSEYSEDTSGKTQTSYTNPVLLKALLASLVTAAGISPEDITVYDVSRLFPDYMVKLCSEGCLAGIKFVGRNNGAADKNAPIVWSQNFSGSDVTSYLPTCVTEATYMINLANLKGHSWGITLCGKNHFGSFINANYVRPPVGANLHQFMTASKMNSYTALVDLMANYQLGGKTVLYMLDALICAPSEVAAITGENSRWQQAPFNGNYTASLFVSQDPVAIDSVGVDFLMNEPTIIKENGAVRHRSDVENYLHEAGLVANPPSGGAYRDGTGRKVENLGVHEHWHTDKAKMYSRNLGREEGIELMYLDADGH